MKVQLYTNQSIVIKQQGCTNGMKNNCQYNYQNNAVENLIMKYYNYRLSQSQNAFSV